MTHSVLLPPGQTERASMPRFGLGKFARQIRADHPLAGIEIRGEVESSICLEERLQTLTRVEQRADFHCVTTWSVRDVTWSGWRFADVYRQIIEPEVRPLPGAEVVVFRAADGFAGCLPLADLLADDVLLADRIGGNDLGAEHGAPLRLVAPAHYGYKNIKHLVAIEFWSDRSHYRFPFPYPQFMDHPRARVALEERGRWIPNWVLRPVYRLLIAPTAWMARKALGRAPHSNRH